ncbi:hypothetical protein LNP09_01625 [Apilactobacillus kunkeei]|nr:hypothetical protein [Apilactobacillus kunkeei]MCK8619670.1 hypothetical protein [Apilactobacillus kunkeei]
MNIYIVRIRSKKKEIKVVNDILGVYTDEHLAYECIRNEIKENPFI